MKNKNGENAKDEPTNEQKAEIAAAKLKRKIANIHIFVNSLEVTIEKYNPAIDGNKRALMLPQTKLPLGYDPETKELFVSAALKPQLFSRKKCKFFRNQWDAGSEGKPLIVTKLNYYKIRLKMAKGLLELYKKSESMESVKSGSEDQRKQYKELMKQYKALSSDERKSEAGQQVFEKMFALHEAMQNT